MFNARRWLFIDVPSDETLHWYHRDLSLDCQFPLINLLLISANAYAFFIELGKAPGELEAFIFANGLIPAQFWGNPSMEWKAILSSMFLHGGWFHILSNMWVLYIFGDNIEARMGGMRYLVFYLVGGTVAALMQAFILPSSTVPMIGASGAVAGVLGAYLILCPNSRIASLVPIFFIFTLVELPAFVFLVFWFISQLYSGLFALQGSAGGIAWWAHMGGFLFGIFIAFFFRRRTVSYRYY